MNEKVLIKSVLESEMPDFEVVRRKAIQAKPASRKVSINRWVVAGASLCVAVALFVFLPNLMHQWNSSPREMAIMMPKTEEAKEEAKSEEMEEIRDQSSDQLAEKPKNNVIPPKQEMKSETNQTDSSVANSDLALEETKEANSDTEENQIYFNDLSESDDSGKAKFDLDVVEMEKVELNPQQANLVEHLEKITGLEQSYYGDMYIKAEGSQEYSVLRQSTLVLSSLDQRKDITIHYSSVDWPLRDYFVDRENAQTSFINNQPITIFQDAELKLSLAIFEHQGIYYDIESLNMSNHDFIQVLEEIIGEK